MDCFDTQTHMYGVCNRRAEETQPNVLPFRPEGNGLGVRGQGQVEGHGWGFIAPARAKLSADDQSIPCAAFRTMGLSVDSGKVTRRHTYTHLHTHTHTRWEKTVKRAGPQISMSLYLSFFPMANKLEVGLDPELKDSKMAE